MKEVVEKAKEDGYVETLFHRRRYLPELTASNFNLRAFGERVARNMPIQGTAADIIKIAMVRVDQRLKRENMILEDENKTLKKKLQKAYDFMKRFTINGLNMLESFFAIYWGKNA